jgi:hypothetical protein
MPGDLDHGAQGVRVSVPQGLLVPRHELPERPRGLIQFHFLLQGKREVVHGGQCGRVIISEEAPGQFQRFPAQALCLGVSAQVVEHARAAVHRSQGLRVLLSLDAALDLQDLTKEGLGLRRLPGLLKPAGVVVDRLQRLAMISRKEPAGRLQGLLDDRGRFFQFRSVERRLPRALSAWRVCRWSGPRVSRRSSRALSRWGRAEA